MNIWVVIPAFNEARVIRQVVETVLARYPQVVVVDDASMDDTIGEARRTRAHVLQHIINRGQGAALKTGISYSLGQGAGVVVTFDADGQHSIDDIPTLLAPITAGTHDIVLGSRFLRSADAIPPLRRLVLRLAVLFTRWVSGIKVTDTHNGLRAMTAEAAGKIRIVQDRMAHASEILDEIVRHRLRYVEVPVTITYSYYARGKGQSSLAMFKIAFKFLVHKIWS
ncbi:MAG: glycosyltransferase family 2 protein [Candidatus Kerfeldbacteria bacterium]|nr:glycosyltransferase family 2 protein [Candidatus Kerfeldbacteria bacterium]